MGQEDREINKWCVMEILNERGVVSYDKWNYDLMDVENIITFHGEYYIRVNFGAGVCEPIDINYYNKFVRDYKLKQIL
jgi:hypothetical protein